MIISCQSKKNKDTPNTDISAPTTTFSVIFWWKKYQLGNNIIIGVVAISVEAMPAAVYCTAIKEKPTPRNGPNITASISIPNPLWSLWLASNRFPSPRTKSHIAKHINPAIQRIIFAEKGRISQNRSGKRCNRVAAWWGAGYKRMGSSEDRHGNRNVSFWTDCTGGRTCCFVRDHWSGTSCWWNAVHRHICAELTADRIFISF